MVKQNRGAGQAGGGSYEDPASSAFALGNQSDPEVT